jgi:hypothetical protein
MDKHINTNNTPALVVVAYNRANSLKRLLGSIENARYDGYDNIPLIISMDHSDNNEVKTIADAFNWEHGTKKIIVHDTRLGLRNHILRCGDMSAEYGAVIVLEDDLFVSREFYRYAVMAKKFYENDPHIAGISLYCYDFNEYAFLNFSPIEDGYDTYFMQMASSWGQLWTTAQWGEFRTWYQTEKANVITDADVPPIVATWTESSWKKYFIKYLIAKHKYFVFPRISLTTNFCDTGIHHQGRLFNFQVPLLISEKKFLFSNLEESVAIYDSFYEIEARCLKKIAPHLQPYEFECDFYGTKPPETLRKPYVLTIRNCNDYVESYGLEHIPHEQNVIFMQPGDDYRLARKESIGQLSIPKRIKQHLRLQKKSNEKIYALLFIYSAINFIYMKLLQIIKPR